MFNELDNKIKSLCNVLQESLKTEIQNKHYGTGELYDSITVRPEKQGDSFVMRFTSDYWIKYLDEGQFFKRWLETNKQNIKDILTLSVKQDVLNMVKDFKSDIK